MQAARLIGSAGSGKTSALLGIMEGALPGLGNDPMALGLASFTKAARSEAASRAAKAWKTTPEALTRDGWFRTVHSVCYRQLGIQKGQLLTDTKADMEWLVGEMGVKLASSLDDESGSHVFIGDPAVSESLNAWNYHRASLVPLDVIVRQMSFTSENMPSLSEVQKNVEKYESAKNRGDRCDFSDILLRYAGIKVSPRHGISEGRPEGELPPVRAWLFDEQQDASPLLDAVCKRLVSGPKVKWCYVVGDPFQSIFGFAGSSAKCFMGWKVAKEKIMPKSYRCPKEILALGEQCLRAMSLRGGYFDRKVQPADHKGEVIRHQSTEDLTRRIDANEDWLFLARTNYQCSRLFGYLNSIGIPAKSTKAQDEPTVRQRGLAALSALEAGDGVRGEEWCRAVEILPSRAKDGPLLVRGTKTTWRDPEMARKWDVVFPADLIQLGGTERLVEEIRSGGWESFVDNGSIWRRQVKKYGIARAKCPLVRVGTIHSAKGLEATNVAVLTTTSTRVAKGALDEDQADEECRLAYVAVTRAKRSLHLIEEGGKSVPRMEALM